jgi:hypothetical protein
MMRRLFRFSAAVALGAALAWFFPVGVSTQGGAQGGAAAVDPASLPTPRTADGKPDLSGLWNGGRGGGGGGQGGNRPDEQGNLRVLQRGRPCHPGQECAPGINAERDSGIMQRRDPNKPQYKPEFWERVQYLDLNGNAEDPAFGCFPAGIPRVGSPTKIVQTATEVIMFYPQGGAQGAVDAYRIVPIDGRPHDPIYSQDTTYFGDSVGRWEGDTLVVDVVGLIDNTWLAWPGYFHTNNMHVVERFTRKGNTLTWQATVEDPEVLMKPWVMNPVTRYLNTNPRAFLPEGLPCEERDLQHMVTKERG